MRVLLSIKPEFVYKIFSGEKRFEFRRVIFRRPDVNTVVVYASSPIQRVVGEFTIHQILCDDILSLWSKTHERSGITQELFLSYFRDRNHGFAIEIGAVTRYRKPLSLSRDFGLSPPQSYAYIS